MTELALFDVAPLYVPPAGAGEDPPVRLSTDARRRQRQQDAAAGGYHPLYVSLGMVLRLHPHAGPYTDRAAAGLRCGTCRFRRHVHGGKRTYPKCLWPDPDTRPAGGWPRVTHGPGTDVQAGWPACELYQPREAS